MSVTAPEWYRTDADPAAFSAEFVGIVNAIRASELDCAIGMVFTVLDRARARRNEMSPEAYDFARGRAHSFLGEVASMRGERQAFLYNFAAAIGHLERTKMPGALARAHRGLALAYLTCDTAALAVEHIERAARLVPGIDREVIRVRAQFECDVVAGLVLTAIGRLSDADKYVRAAAAKRAQILAATQDPWLPGLADLALGDFSVKKGISARSANWTHKGIRKLRETVRHVDSAGLEYWSTFARERLSCALRESDPVSAHTLMSAAYRFYGRIDSVHQKKRAAEWLRRSEQPKPVEPGKVEAHAGDGLEPGEEPAVPIDACSVLVKRLVEILRHTEFELDGVEDVARYALEKTGMSPKTLLAGPVTALAQLQERSHRLSLEERAVLFAEVKQWFGENAALACIGRPRRRSVVDLGDLVSRDTALVARLEHVLRGTEFDSVAVEGVAAYALRKSGATPEQLIEGPVEALARLTRQNPRTPLQKTEADFEVAQSTFGLKVAVACLRRPKEGECRDPEHLASLQGAAELHEPRPISVSSGDDRMALEYPPFLRADGDLIGSLFDAVREMKRFFVTKKLVENNYDATATCRALGLNKPAAPGKRPYSGISTLSYLINSLEIPLWPAPQRLAPPPGDGALESTNSDSGRTGCSQSAQEVVETCPDEASAGSECQAPHQSSPVQDDQDACESCPDEASAGSECQAPDQSSPVQDDQDACESWPDEASVGSECQAPDQSSPVQDDHDPGESRPDEASSTGSECQPHRFFPFLRDDWELKGSLREAAREMKRHFIVKHFIENGRNLSATSRALGYNSLQTLKPYIVRMGLEIPSKLGGGSSKGTEVEVPEHIPFLRRDGGLNGSLNDAVREMKRYFITKSLIENGYNLSATSRALGLGKPPTAPGTKKSKRGLQTLRYMIASLGIEMPPRPRHGTATRNAPTRSPRALSAAKR